MTSIEWLIEKMQNNIHHTIKIPSEYVEQAKLLHKQEIIDAYGDGLNAHRTDFCNRDEYFAKTYGSKGSDDHISDISKMVDVPKQETLYTEEQVREALKYGVDNSEIIKRGCKNIEGFIQSLKQPKK
jgi:hypothetical protein